MRMYKVIQEAEALQVILVLLTEVSFLDNEVLSAFALWKVLKIVKLRRALRHHLVQPNYLLNHKTELQS